MECNTHNEMIITTKIVTNVFKKLEHFVRETFGTKHGYNT